MRIFEMQSQPVSIASDAGSVILAWQEKRGGIYDIVVRKLDAAGAPLWPAIVVCDAPGPQWFPALVSDGAGGAIIAWDDARSGAYWGLYAQGVDSAGVPRWADDGVALCPATYVGESAALIADGAGGAVVVWTDWRSGTDYDLYAQRVNAAGVPQWATDGVAVSTAPLDAETPVLLADGAGGATIAWSERDAGTYETDLYAQRVSAAGVPQWTANGVAVCTAPNDAGSPAMVSDGADGAVVAWEDFRHGWSVRVYVQRVSAAGVPQWTANGVAVRTVSYDGRNFVLASDGAGGAIVSWENWSTIPYASDIYAQRVNSAGAPLWSTSGVSLCSTTGPEHYPAMVADGAGGAVVTWEDSRSGTHSDVYAQRVDSTGALQWAATGAVVCAALGGQRELTAAPAGASGAVIAWVDSRNGTLEHIRAQRLDGSGVAQWYADGVTPTALSLVSATSDLGLVRLTWYSGGGDVVTATVYRRTEASGWASLGAAAVDGTGQIRFEDRTVAPGGRYGYRLGVVESGTERYYGETWVDVPDGLALALEGFRPNPTGGDLLVAFTLAAPGTARLELLDVAGRQVRAWRLEGLGAGRQVRRLGSAAGLAPGVYLLRLVHGETAVTRRVSVVR